MPSLGVQDHGIWSFSIASKPIKILNPTAWRAYQFNLVESKRNYFVKAMVRILKHKRMILVHKHGHFYSEEYFDKWCQIARHLPHLIIWARFHEEDIIPTPHPANLVTVYYGTGRQAYFDRWANNPDGVLCPHIECSQCMKCLTMDVNLLG